jgi:hypothetical protein
MAKRASKRSATKQHVIVLEVGSNGSTPDHSESAEAFNARMERIALAAYFRAQQRGFAPGNELEDWLEAEREMNQRRDS